MNNTNTHCCGVRILDLEDKRTLEGTEYLAIAEKDNNYKTPVNQITNLLVDDPRIKDLIKEALGDAFNEFQAKVDAQLNQFNQQLLELQNTLNQQTNDKYAELNQRITELENKLKQLTGDLGDLNDQFGNIDDLIGEDKIIQIVNNGIANHKVKILDPVQTAINSGQGITRPMPSANNWKILLNTWTGTIDQYNELQGREDGMTYNIIDEEE